MNSGVFLLVCTLSSLAPSTNALRLLTVAEPFAVNTDVQVVDQSRQLIAFDANRTMQEILFGVDAQTRSAMEEALKSGVDEGSVQQLWSYPFANVWDAASKCAGAKGMAMMKPSLSCNSYIQCHEIPNDRGMCKVPEISVAIGAKPAMDCFCVPLLANPGKSTILNGLKGVPRPFLPQPFVAQTIGAFQNAYTKIKDFLVQPHACAAKPRVLKFIDKNINGNIFTIFESVQLVIKKGNLNVGELLEKALKLPNPLASLEFLQLVNDIFVPALTSFFSASPNANLNRKLICRNYKDIVKFVKSTSKKVAQPFHREICKTGLAMFVRIPQFSDYMLPPMKYSSMACYLDTTCGPWLHDMAHDICMEKLPKMINIALDVLIIADIPPPLKKLLGRLNTPTDPLFLPGVGGALGAEFDCSTMAQSPAKVAAVPSGITDISIDININVPTIRRLIEYLSTVMATVLPIYREMRAYVQQNLNSAVNQAFGKTFGCSR